MHVELAYHLDDALSTLPSLPPFLTSNNSETEAVLFANMTKNHPNLRKTVSTADLSADPSSPPRHPSLSRAFTTVYRPRRQGNPFMQPRANVSQSSLRFQQSDAQAPSQNAPRPSALSLYENHRHSIAAPYASDLIDLEDGYEYRSPQEQQSPPPVPPKIPEIPAFEQKVEAVRSKEGPEKYTKPFTDFMTANPTVFHAVDAVAQDLEKSGYKKLSERDGWELKQGGKYYVERNGSSLISFSYVYTVWLCASASFRARHGNHLVLNSTNFVFQDRRWL
jgi:aminopeptidase I